MYILYVIFIFGLYIHRLPCLYTYINVLEREMELCFKDCICILTSTDQKPSFSRLAHAAKCSKSL